MRSLIDQVKFGHIRPDGAAYHLAAGTTDVNSDAIDVRNCMGVLIVLTLGAVVATGGLSIKVQQSNDSGGSPDDWTDLAGSASVTCADTDDDKMIAIEIRRPLKSFVRLAITRLDAANSEVLSVHYLLFGVRTMPTVQAVTAGQFVIAPETFASPDEGTA
jgi:hypothetical protein